MKLEMEGREPMIVLFGLPIVTTAIVLGSMYLGRMQAEDSLVPAVHVHPNVTVTPHITAEMPQGAIRNEIQVPPAQIHEVARSFEIKAPDVTVVNKIEPTPVQVVMPKAPGSTPQVIVIPAPLPLPMGGAWLAAERGPALKPAATAASDPSPGAIKEALATASTVPTPPPPEVMKPTPVSTDATPEVDEATGAGKLLPPPRNLNGQPETK